MGALYCNSPYDASRFKAVQDTINFVVEDVVYQEIKNPVLEMSKKIGRQIASFGVHKDQKIWGGLCSANGYNEICFSYDVEETSRKSAVNAITWLNTGYNLLFLMETDIMLNAYYWNYANIKNNKVFQMTMIHEILHAYGLDHVREHDNIMYANTSKAGFNLNSKQLSFLRCVIGNKM